MILLISNTSGAAIRLTKSFINLRKSMNASNAPRQTRRARLKIIFLNFQFQTRACQAPGLVSFGSVWLTEPCRQVRIGFGSGSVRLENSGFGRFLTLTYPYTPLTYPYTPLTHLSPLQQPASNSSHNI